MKLNQLINMERLSECIKNGFIVARTYHGKTIYNYTPKTSYSGYWTLETTTLRGVVCDEENNIIARPFAKFFTLEQEQGHYHLCDEEGSFDSNFYPDFNAPIIATDKLDGSLGILWNDNGKPVLATRGCLDGEIAVNFTYLMHENKEMYFCAKDMIERFPHKTFLFELLDPMEHIVHYSKKDIVLLGCVDIESGEWTEACLLNSEWEKHNLPIAQRLECNTFAEALELPERENAEGMVIHFSDGKLIKFKQESYLRAHRLHYNWKKLFIEELKNTTFKEWMNYLSLGTLNSFSSFSKDIFSNASEFENGIKKYLSDIIYLIYLWFDVFSEFENISQKEYALRVFADSVSAQYSGFLFAARKYNGIENLYPFKYIDLEGN